MCAGAFTCVPDMRPAEVLDQSEGYGCIAHLA